MTRKITMVLAAVLCLASCQDQYGRFDPQSAQGSVKFHLGIEGVESKAVYSGEVDGKVERIDWQAGDAIGIYCAQAKEDKYARYVVKSNGTPEGGVSTGEALPDGPELVWGEDVVHEFYSYFPEKSEGGIAKEMSGATVSATLPATQAVKGAITNSVAAPDLKNMLMTAKSPLYLPAGGACEAVVSLEFKPLTTAVQFTITNQTKADMTVASVSLTSAASALCGDFTVDISDTSLQPDAIPLGNKTISYSHKYPHCKYTGDTVSDATRTVSIEFDTPVTLTYDADPAKSGKLTFTFFLQPCQNFDDLTFRVTKEDRSWMQTRLGYTDGSGIVFPRFMKSKVDGIFVPGGAQWTVKYGPTVEPWNQSSDTPIAPMPEIVTDPVVTSWDTGIDEELTLDPADPYNDHEYVDLGLSVKWATMNVGATKPEEYGKYFAWGDVTGQTPATAGDYAFASKPFTWINAPFNNGYENVNSEYFNEHKSEFLSVDNTLKPEYDAACANWGGSWRMPTKAEIDELLDNTDHVRTTDYKGTGVSGYILTSTKPGFTDKSIFLPGAGRGFEDELSEVSDGYYWSSSLFTETSQVDKACYLLLLDIPSLSSSTTGRDYGHSVRPVAE